MLVCYCYHGNSSQGAARFFQERGIKNVYSMAGGFTAWLEAFPDQCEGEGEQRPTKEGE